MLVLTHEKYYQGAIKTIKLGYNSDSALEQPKMGPRKKQTGSCLQNKSLHKLTEKKLT
jgi:hypothetical protein